MNITGSFNPATNAGIQYVSELFFNHLFLNTARNTTFAKLFFDL